MLQHHQTLQSNLIQKANSKKIINLLPIKINLLPFKINYHFQNHIIALMYTGFKVNTSINKSTVSGLNQTQLQTLQRQVDTYTRKLQVQKRKYFAIQDQHRSISDEYNKEKQKLNYLKKQNSKAQSIILQAKIKNLQATLDKAVSSYDDTIAYNNRLKGQIDMLRRQKKNYIQMQRSLDETSKKIESQTSQKVILLNKKKKKAEQLKNQMVEKKTKNQQQRESYLNQFSNLEKQYLHDKNSADMQQSKIKGNDLLSPNLKANNQIVDTQPLLKFRLKRIIAANKQKVKLIDQYKKHMLMIEQAFNQIKQKSNINDLDQITNTFIRSQQQNYSLYNYMDSLSQGIDKLEEENIELQQKIDRKIVQDQLKKQGILGQISNSDQTENKKSSFKKAKQDIAFEQQIKNKEKQTQSLVYLVQKIKPTLQATLIELCESPLSNVLESSPNTIKSSQQYKSGLNISDRNIEQYLSQLQKHINLLLLAKQQAQTKTITQTKDNVTTYSKPIPSVNYEDMIKERQRSQRLQKDQNRFLEQNKFRQYAIQFWQKRKNNNKYPNQQNNIVNQQNNQNSYVSNSNTNAINSNAAVSANNLINNGVNKDNSSSSNNNNTSILSKNGSNSISKNGQN